MKFSHEVTFQIADEVWLRADDEYHGFVSAIQFCPKGVVYLVSWGPNDESEHYDFELSREKVVAT